MADTTMHVTVKYVEPERLRCATAFCKRPGETKNFLIAKCITALSANQPDYYVKLYLCDECMKQVEPTLKRAIPEKPLEAQ